MEIEIGRGKKARRAYGFDDIAIVPSRRTRDPDDVDVSWKLGPYRFELPLMASAMDGVVSPSTAGIIGKLGGLAVLNLEGVFTRYENADEMLERIAGLPKEQATREMQEIYQAPVIPELITQRIQEIKDQGVVTAASLTPQRVSKYYELALEAGLDILVIQGTVVSAEHVSMTSEPLNLKEFIRSVACRSSSAAAPPTTRACTSCARAPRASSSASARARRAPRAASSASGVPQATGHRGRRGRALDPHARDGRVRPGHRRRRDAHGRRRLQGDRLRRGRRHDRLPAGRAPRGARATASTGGWRRSTRRCRAARACRPSRTARSRRSCSAPRTRTTARSTSSAACARRWPPAAIRTWRSSTGPRS
jgi:IMP dehydrogenase/GMP reductase